MTHNSPASDWSVVYILTSDWLIFVMGLEIQCSVHLVYAHAINVSFILGTIKTFHHYKHFEAPTSKIYSIFYRQVGEIY